MSESETKWRRAMTALYDAVIDPSAGTSGTAVDAILDAAVSKINDNLRSELAQVRALVCATPEETTVGAVKRLLRERDAIHNKYDDVKRKLSAAMREVAAE